MANIINEGETRFSDPDDFNSQIREFVKLKSSMDILEARSKELREKLFAQLDLNGEVDDKGNIQLVLDEAVDEVVRIEKQRRASRKLNEEAADEIIEELGLSDEVYEMKRVINEDALMAAFYEEKITEEQLDTMFPVTVTWALRTLKK
jgi:glycine/D-amino acid oxidase-like deaminating enzyme